MWLVLIATLGGLALSSLLKGLFLRPRPRVVPSLSYIATTSFPSGHSMLAAIVYLTLGSLLARLSPRKRIKLYFLGLAMLVTVLVGISRVCMGVHYPTDVLAGWSAGLAWAWRSPLPESDSAGTSWTWRMIQSKIRRTRVRSSPSPATRVAMAW